MTTSDVTWTRDTPTGVGNYWMIVLGELLPMRVTEEDLREGNFLAGLWYGPVDDPFARPPMPPGEMMPPVRSPTCNRCKGPKFYTGSGLCKKCWIERAAEKARERVCDICGDELSKPAVRCRTCWRIMHLATRMERQGFNIEAGGQDFLEYERRAFALIEE